MRRHHHHNHHHRRRHHRHHHHHRRCRRHHRHHRHHHHLDCRPHLGPDKPAAGLGREDLVAEHLRSGKEWTGEDLFEERAAVSGRASERASEQQPSNQGTKQPSSQAAKQPATKRPSECATEQLSNQATEQLSNQTVERAGERSTALTRQPSPGRQASERINERASGRAAQPSHRDTSRAPRACSQDCTSCSASPCRRRAATSRRCRSIPR